MQLTGSGGPYTGSQALAARLFDYPDTDIEHPTLSDAPTAKRTYLDYKSYLLISQSSTGVTIPTNSLGDDSKTLNALLYFPSRPNISSSTASNHYKWADNSVYSTETGASGRFGSKCIVDDREGDVRNPGGILIIATGINDTYLESTDNDDINSWDID
ncbi:MAG: hypothetical protein GY794_20815 [bacterium]|nr:hypothetical protein [bacterium]